MTRRAGLLLTAVLVVAFPVSCARRQPVPPASPVAAPFSGSFKVVLSSPSGTLRLAGVLAAGPSGAMRIEISRGGESFILVAGDGAQSATLSLGRIFMSETGEAGLVRKITATGFGAPEISAALLGDRGAVPEGCSLEPRRWRSPGGDLHVATRISLRCGDEEMKLRLSDLAPLDPARAARAFDPLRAPAGYLRVDAEGMARAILDAISGRGAATGR